MALGSSASWSSIPPDLLGLFFALLPPRDLFAAAAVCRAWRRHSIVDSLWAAHLAQRLHDALQVKKGNLKAEELVTMRLAGQLPALSLRDMYILSLAMADKPQPYRALANNNLARASGAHLEIIRDATQLGFDPLRHTAPSWANALRLMRLWAVRGTRTVAAVGETCASYGYPIQQESPIYYPMDFHPGPTFTSHRGRAYRTLIARCQVVMGVAFVAPYVALCVLCRMLLPRYANALTLALAVPVSLTLTSHALFVTSPTRIAPQTFSIALAAAHVVHAALLHISGAHWSYRLLMGRVIVGSAVIFVVTKLRRRYGDAAWVCVLFSLFDYGAPLLCAGLCWLPLAEVRRLSRAVLSPPPPEEEY